MGLGGVYVGPFLSKGNKSVTISSDRSYNGTDTFLSSFSALFLDWIMLRKNTASYSTYGHVTLELYVM